MKTKVFMCFCVIGMLLSLCVSAKGRTDERDVVNVPTIMYHRVGNENNELTVSVDKFRMHMETLYENGYTPVSLQELVDYVDDGAELPQKPVCITFDDGYLDNYLNAYPVLKEFNFKATIFAIGSSMGKNTYKESGIPIFPHFGFEEAKNMSESGLIAVQSHTYDMHQSKEAEGRDDVRDCLMYFPGENLKSYLTALENDIIIEKLLLESKIGKPVIGIAYPKGRYNGLIEIVLRKNGIRVSFATSEGANYIRKKDIFSLYSLNRYNLYNWTTSEYLLELLGEE